MKLSKSQLRELASREKRMAAIHEAGHAVMATHLGGVGVGRIWRNQSTDPEQRAWLGQFVLMAAPGTVEYPPDVERILGMPLAIEIPVNWAHWIGMAGEVATRLAENAAIDLEELAFELDESLEVAPQICTAR